MAEDALIRLANLKALGHSPTDLVRLIGSTYTYWRDLLAGQKSFGEKAARNIEAKLGLPRGCLDIEGSCEKQRRQPAAQAAQPGPGYDVLSEAERVLLQNFRDLPDPDQVELAAEIAARAEKARGYIRKVLSGQAALAALQTHTPEQGYASQAGRTTSVLETLSARLDKAVNGDSDKNRRRGPKRNAGRS